MSEPPIEASLVQTLRNSDLTSLAQSGGELALDSILSEGFLKELPVIQSIVGLVKVGVSIRNMAFARKLLRFLSALSDVPQAERSEMVARLEADEKFGQKVGEYVTTLLERMDDERKPPLMAKAFKLYCRGQIDSSQLTRLNYAIDRVLLSEVHQLQRAVVPGLHQALPSFDSFVEQNFLNSGLVYVASGLMGKDKLYPTEECRRLLTLL